MSENKVVALSTGAPIVQPGHPDDRLVAEIEGLLAKARAGDVMSIAYVEMYSDGTSGHGIAGQYRPVILLGAIELLKRDV